MMTLKVQAIYEKGILRPLESLELPENQILDITLDWKGKSSNPHSRLVQLQGVIKNYPLGDMQTELKNMRKQLWNHLDAESIRE